MSPERLLQVLADGRTHSSDELARCLGVTRAVIRQEVAKLADWGLAVEAAPGAEYRLARRVDLLDAAELRAALDPATAARIAKLDVFTEIDSTNRHLLMAPPPLGKLDVCVAEFQTAGRGRRGRCWRAPFGGGICLSVGWLFAAMPAQPAALTLAVGVAVRRALERVAGLTIALKWPNDLVYDERKLGGVLLEIGSGPDGGAHAVTGIGLNVALPPELLPSLSDWPHGAVDLTTALGNEPPPRAALTSALVDELAVLFMDYPARGFAAYRTEWCSADHLRGRRVRLDEETGSLLGTARGIDADGALLVETEGGARRRVVAGDVSLRSDA
jgi:BirA family biotin operon repressor/biotin-[acetyl-CoA-carboxylase] ligase